MAVSNQYIVDMLMNYLDNHGGMDGLKTNKPKIYNLVISRRKGSTGEEKGVNDYIYSVLKVKPQGQLGEELTYLICGHLLAYDSLKNLKDAPFYSRLANLAKKKECSVEQLLIDANYYNYLDKPVRYINQKHLNTLYSMTANVFEAIFTSSQLPIGRLLTNYLQEKGTLANIDIDLPELYKQISNTLSIEFGDIYKDKQADAILRNQKLHLKDELDTVIPTVNTKTIIIEMLYILFGYKPNEVLPPSTRFLLDRHLKQYKSLHNLYRVNPLLYNSLKRRCIVERKFDSLADMLRSEGYYYPVLNTDAIQLIPCQDKNHLIYINNQLSQPIILDKASLAYLMENNLLNSLIIREIEGVKYAHVVFKQNSKKTDIPFHTLFLKNEAPMYADGNFLNVSSDNFIVRR